MKRKLRLDSLYLLLRKRLGHRNWWPGETPDEIVIGAILTQQASWKNAELAIANLREKNMLSLERIASSDLRKLERCVRPSGFYRQKARRLKAISSYIIGNGGSLKRFLDKDHHDLRKELLSLDGIGPETADSIILYAAEKPIFVIDAYTKRIMSRVYGTDPEIDYHELQELITGSIPRDVGLYNDFHAQFVELGKNFCRTKPLCGNCPVRDHCRYYKTTYSK